MSDDEDVSDDEDISFPENSQKIHLHISIKGWIQDVEIATIASIIQLKVGNFDEISLISRKLCRNKRLKN